MLHLLKELSKKDKMYKKIELKDVFVAYFNISFAIQLLDESEIKTITDIISFFKMKGESSALLTKLNTQLLIKMLRESNMDSIRELLESVLQTINESIINSGIRNFEPEDILLSMAKFFMKLREIKKKYLPPMKELLINDILFLVIRAHAGIQNRNNLDTIDIPSNMNLYRVMTAEYGTASCSYTSQVYKYIDIIENSLLDPPKQTEKKNIKLIKEIGSKVLKETQKVLSLDKKKNTNNSVQHIIYQRTI
jgi:hypothetical protein